MTKKTACLSAQVFAARFEHLHAPVLSACRPEALLAEPSLRRRWQRESRATSFAGEMASMSDELSMCGGNGQTATRMPCILGSSLRA